MTLPAGWKQAHYLYCADNLSVLRKMPAQYVDAVLTDPPYGLLFMGKRWDYDVPSVALWREVFRVLKPGGHVLTFGGARTYHRLVCRVEDAGFEIRDQLQWIYGSGFPKALDVSRALDNAAGAEREQETAPVTDAARQWEGWGTALKPANEPICLARKPLGGPVAENVLQYGTGALNVDGCRIAAGNGDYDHPGNSGISGTSRVYGLRGHSNQAPPNASGRWPANVMLGCACEEEEHDAGCAVRALDAGAGATGAHGRGAQPYVRDRPLYRGGVADTAGEIERDTGGASRFFYCSKASRSEREAWGRVENRHPTVKPVALLRYLARLITPPGGILLDPYVGSGSTAVACDLEGFRCLGIDEDAENVRIAQVRTRYARRGEW